VYYPLTQLNYEVKTYKHRKDNFVILLALAYRDTPLLGAYLCVGFADTSLPPYAKTPRINRNTEKHRGCFSPVNRDIKMAPPCKRYRKVYTWHVSSIRHIINIAEFATLGGCRSPRHTGE
jgi:hypothetical protein